MKWGNWDNTHLKQLRDNHISLVESIQAFHAKLKRHCLHEETDLLPLLGKLVSDVNVIEHREIMNQIQLAYNLLKEAKLLGELNETILFAQMRRSLLKIN